ncbi:MAG: crossover junction endodeoxyribonuclease RuvC [Dehalococcoidia bacterium]|jgi:crossover junction endodeoxyribonuclease RuvC|nr:crossover junction endodeoxyribonuclease RuvC [Dehalococcoidia bacterium]
MRILGVDPGTINLGYGVVDGEEEMHMVDCGVVSLSARLPMEERLRSLYSELSKIIARHKPSEVAIEDPFIGHNVKSAFAIGKAQAIAILAAANKGLPIYYYSPAKIKKQITSYGQSDKQQVQEMVRVQLGLSEPPQPNDAADALAVAMCHIQQRRLSQWLTEHTPK